MNQQQVGGIDKEPDYLLMYEVIYLTKAVTCIFLIYFK